MRVILIIVLWVLLGIFYWFCKDKCCANGNGGAPVSEIEAVTPIEKRVVKKLTPLKFACSDAQPNAEPAWVAFRDSLVSNLSDDSQLQIQGLYSKDESFSGDTDLGMARAKNVLKLFENLESDRVKLSSGNKGDECLQEELNNLIAFRYLKNTKKIKEIDDRTLIYFPFNSTKQIADKEIEAYLNDVAKRVVASGEKVRLTGHTDNVDSDAFNMELGEKRATAISNYLIRRGVNPNKIMIRSKGERQPIGDNKTEEGRAKNRRTELQIVK
ncbi:MAG: OmpA family protein [Saprospiraceae bacterium]|nr:OmpA family protein [Bacteroidia bacterium]NNE15249.1 OmpA family protein [Saprospiraceae bacterium]NNL93105.1 OmpA family protein [Saprospiraceae bacterium]